MADGREILEYRGRERPGPPGDGTWMIAVALAVLTAAMLPGMMIPFIGAVFMLLALPFGVLTILVCVIGLWRRQVWGDDLRLAAFLLSLVVGLVTVVWVVLHLT